MWENRQRPEQEKEQQEHVSRLPDSSFTDPSAIPVSLVEISAFPSSLKEQPWSKDIQVILNAGDTATSVQVTWSQVECDLDGLGKVEVYPTLLKIHLEQAVQPGICSLTLYDRDQHEFGTISPGSSLEHLLSPFSGRMCLLKIRDTSGLSQQSRALVIQVQLYTFQALLSVSSRNLWWLEGGEERRKWQGNEVEYVNPRFLLEDLGAHVERFIAEAGVIGYEERRRKLARILFALGRVAQAIGAYPQAVQFYGKSRQKFQSFHDIAATESILRILRDLFLRQGKKEQAKHVDFELLNLKASQ